VYNQNQATLIQKLFQIPKEDIFLGKAALTKNQKHKLYVATKKLESGFPLDYITKKVKINNYTFHLNKNILIPRPETEELIEIIKKYQNNQLLVDIGCGSGLIGITLSKSYKSIILTDISTKVLKITQKNISENKITNAKTFKSNLLKNQNLQKQISTKAWNLVANLPYVPNHDRQPSTKFEPDSAIYSGKDGLDLYRQLIQQLQNLNNQPNFCFFELDPRNIQSAAKILSSLQYKIGVIKDSNNHQRFLVGQKITN
jgi:release factor glutamine methyltransferase